MDKKDYNSVTNDVRQMYKFVSDTCDAVGEGKKLYHHDVVIKDSGGGSYLFHIVSFSPSPINSLEMLMNAASCLNADTLKVYNDNNEYILSMLDADGDIALQVITDLFDEAAPKFSLIYTGIDPADVTSIQDTVVKF